MRDQVDGLKAVDDRVELINAQQDVAANRWALDRALNGRLRLLYVAPERFSSPGFAERIRQADVGLFVVDEAHCVSQWGHDFRPDYFRLADAARYVGARALVASTATATPRVAADIVARLGLRDPVKVTTGFDRPNLAFSVVPSRSPADKARRLAEALAAPGARPAIVYAGTRVASEALGAELRAALGVEVVVYHAGLGRAERAEAQERFMSGEAEVVVATNAFGMGVDKADVRTVVHATVPPLARGLLPGGGPRRPRRRAGAGAAVRQPARQGAARVLHRAGAARGGRVRGRRPHRRALGRRRRALRRAGRGAGPRRRSRRRQRARGARAPGPGRRAAAGAGAAGSRGGACRWRRSTGARSPSAAPPPTRPSGRAGASTARSGATSRSSTAAGRPSSATSAIRRRRCRAARAATSATPRRYRPRRSRRRWSPRRAAVADGDLDSAIVEVVTTARPAVGRTRTVEILRGRALARDPRPRLRRPARLRHLRRTSRADEVLGRVDAMLADGRLHSTGGRFPKLAA